MRRAPKKIINIYSSSITYEDIELFIERLEQIERDSNQKCRVSITISDKTQYSYNTAKEYFENKQEIERIKKSLVSSIMLSIGSFSVSLDSKGFSRCEYELGDPSSTTVFNVMEDLANVRTNPFIFKLLKGKPIAFLFCYLVSGYFIGVSIEWIALASFLLCLLLLVSFPSTTQKVTFKMGTSKDRFFVRKKDDIIIAALATLVGYISGSMFPISDLFK